MIQEQKIIFFAYALKLKLISFQAVNDWIYSVIEKQELVDCPDHFFEMASMNEHQLLEFFVDQRFYNRATPEIAKMLFQYFMSEKDMCDAASFLAFKNYKKMYEIAIYLGLYGLSNRIAWIDDEDYINCAFPDLNSIDYLQFVEEILLDINRFIHDPDAEEWRI